MKNHSILIIYLNNLKLKNLSYYIIKKSFERFIYLFYYLIDKIAIKIHF